MSNEFSLKARGVRGYREQFAVRGYRGAFQVRGYQLGGLGASDQQKSLVSTGASTGATVGSVFPVVGTAIGAVIGAVVGLIGSAFVGTRRPESDLWDKYKLSAGSAAGHEYDNQFRNGAFVGLMRFAKNTFPPRAKGGYGPKDDAKFLRDMFAKIGEGFDTGVLGANETPASIYSKVVGPWIAQWGTEPNADWAKWERQILVDLIDAWMFEQPVIATSYTTSTWATPRITDIAAKIVGKSAPGGAASSVSAAPGNNVASPGDAAPLPQPINSGQVNAPGTVGPAVTLPYIPAVPAPGGGAAPQGLPAVTQDLSAYVNALLAQGKSQQDTFTSALNALSSAGVSPTAQVQSQVAEAVKASATGSSLPGWVFPAAIAGVLVMVQLMMHKKGRH